MRTAFNHQNHTTIQQSAKWNCHFQSSLLLIAKWLLIPLMEGVGGWLSISNTQSRGQRAELEHLPGMNGHTLSRHWHLRHPRQDVEDHPPAKPGAPWPQALQTGRRSARWCGRTRWARWQWWHLSCWRAAWCRPRRWWRGRMTPAGGEGQEESQRIPTHPMKGCTKHRELRTFKKSCMTKKNQHVTRWIKIKD